MPKPIHGSNKQASSGLSGQLERGVQELLVWVLLGGRVAVTSVETGCVCECLPGFQHALTAPSHIGGHACPEQWGGATPRLGQACLVDCSPAVAGDKHLCSSAMAKILPEAQGGTWLQESLDFQTFPSLQT